MEALMHPFLQKWNPLNVISSDRVRALTLSCLAEFATSPAVSFIVVEFAEKPQIVREEGVTVRDVIEEMADAFEACKSVYVDSDAEDLSGAQVCTWHDFYWEDETAYYNWHGWEKPDVVMVD